MDTRPNKVPVTPPSERTLEECKAELLTWAKKRFWLLAVILSVVAFFGIKSLIGETVRTYVESELKTMKEARDKAWRAGILAEDRAAAAMAAVAEADKQLSAYTKTISELQQELDALQKSAQVVAEQYLVLQQGLDSETRNIRGLIDKDVNDVKVRLDRLDELVAKLAREPQAGRLEVKAYEEKAAIMRRETKKFDLRFTDNARYQVSVYFNERTKSLSDNALEKVTEAGFKASALDMAQVRELLYPAVQKKQDLFRMTQMELPKDNVIIYRTSDTRTKAEEVGKLISSVPGVGKLKVVLAERFENPIFVQTAKTRLSTNNLIEVYLVQAE